MNGNEHPRNTHDDEISLVDLAVTFVKRRRVFYVVFLLCTLTGVAYALIAENTYRYTSLVQGAMLADDQSLTAPASIVAALDGRWLPEVKAEYEASGKTLPFKVTFETPKDTPLVKISSEATEESAELVKRIHSGLMDRLKDAQTKQLDERRKRLEQQLASVTKVVESLQESGGSGEAMAAAVERKLNLQLEISGLDGPRDIVVARPSSEPTGPKRALIVALSVLVGGLLAVFGAFFAEFLASVRERIEKNA